MNRPAVPAEIRRGILCEAGHRCAIPSCRHPTVDVHHIVPWEDRKSHDFENLIALCPNCHRRADAGQIDRKSLRWYKSQLSAAIGAISSVAHETEGTAGKISEVHVGNPGYEFQFEYPLFSEPAINPVEKELEVLGNGLLQEHRRQHALWGPTSGDILGGPNTMEGAFEIVRHDSTVLSIKYRLNQYRCGAAHGTGRTITKTYFKNPLYQVTLTDLFVPKSDFLLLLSEYCRSDLLSDPQKDGAWVRRGTEPNGERLRAFNVTQRGLLMSFDEYEVDCFAAGPQTVAVPYEKFKQILNPHVPRLWWPSVV
jgi:hypothetical protein